MDIRENNFWQTLPTVLWAISRAEYVSLDLEMTGVRIKNSDRSSKPTMEMVYQQAKEAAATFNILQVGLTCLHYAQDIKGEDRYFNGVVQDLLTSTAGYRSHTFNFYLTPVRETYQ
jgi:poly(A)-specific ribonuclease